MPTRFEEFAETLPDSQRDALYATVPMLIARIGGADGDFDGAEMVAAVDGLITAHDSLGRSFRHAPAAEEAFARIAELAAKPDPLEFHGHLMRVRDALRAMPPELADGFRAIVLRVALHVAGASGSFLGITDPISDDERAALVRVIRTLEIPVDDRLGRHLGIVTESEET